jgi:7,8-dihydro-6-hydroxymethylpterin-pyrophosphokinase
MSKRVESPVESGSTSNMTYLEWENIDGERSSLRGPVLAPAAVASLIVFLDGIAPKDHPDFLKIVIGLGGIMAIRAMHRRINSLEERFNRRNNTTS